jgi:hypothetical protein
MATARQIAETYFAAALDRGDLEDALRQLRHDVEFTSPAAKIRGRDELRPYLEDSPVRSPTRATGTSSRRRVRAERRTLYRPVQWALVAPPAPAVEGPA